MNKQEKRVAIAKDALSQLKKNHIKAAPGDFVTAPHIACSGIIETSKDFIGFLDSDVVKKGGACTVCAAGYVWDMLSRPSFVSQILTIKEKKVKHV